MIQRLSNSYGWIVTIFGRRFAIRFGKGVRYEKPVGNGWYIPTRRFR